MIWKCGFFRAEIVDDGISLGVSDFATFLIKNPAIHTLEEWAWAASDHVGYATAIIPIQDSTLTLVYNSREMTINFENITGDYKFTFTGDVPREELAGLGDLVAEYVGYYDEESVGGTDAE